MESNEFQSALSGIGCALTEHRATFTALGDPNRQAILIELLNHYGGMRVNEIAEAVNLSRPATSHHLKTLCEAGLADMYRKGTMNFYHAQASASEWRAIARLADSVSRIAEAAAHRSESEIESAERCR